MIIIIIIIIIILKGLSFRMTRIFKAFASKPKPNQYESFKDNRLVISLLIRHV